MNGKEDLEELKCKATVEYVDNLLKRISELNKDLAACENELVHIHRLLNEAKKGLEFYTQVNFSIELDSVVEWHDGITSHKLGTKAKQVLDYIDKHWKPSDADK